MKYLIAVDAYCLKGHWREEKFICVFKMLYTQLCCY